MTHPPGQPGGGGGGTGNETGPGRDLASMTASPFDVICRVDASGEYWSARDLMPLLGYDKWERFEDAVERARATVANTGGDPDSHASRHREASGRTERINFRLTRYGAYLVAMNGDSRKAEIAAAQSYFAIKAREAETGSAPALPRSYAEALRELAAAVEDREQATAALAIAAPKAEAWEVLASAEGDFSVADAAKILSRDPNIKIGATRLFSVLCKAGWIFRQTADNRWRVYQTAVETGRLSEIPASHYHPRTGELVLDSPQVRVTAKGLEELRRRLTSRKDLSADEGARPR
jgi:DNA-damage-inducible protein D